MDVNPFGRENPLGPGDVLRSYRSAANAVGSGLTYGKLVGVQESLDLSGIDAGLAVTVAAHQADLKQQAQEFVDTVAADFIQLSSDVDNFVAAVVALAGDAATMRQLSSERSWAGVGEMLESIGDNAGEIGVDGDTAIDHVEVLRQDVNRSGRKLDSVMKRAILAVDESGKAAAARIDDLTSKISDNIQAIVDGATETGDAFTSLGIGILTMITKASGDKPPAPSSDDDDDDDDDDGDDADESGDSDSDDDDDSDDEASGDDDADDDDSGDEASDGGDASDDDADDDDEDDDDEESASTKNKSDGKVPDVSFVVNAIKAGSKGTEKHVAAIANLNRNNERLAVQYQRLAASDRLVAVAKATQAQKNLFATSVVDAAAAIKTIRREWTRLQTAFAAWSSKTDPDDAATLARLVPGATKQWQAVGAEIRTIRRSLTGARSQSGR